MAGQSTSPMATPSLVSGRGMRQRPSLSGQAASSSVCLCIFCYRNSLTPKRNPLECVLKQRSSLKSGYDRADKNTIANRGGSITIDATNNDTHIWRNLKGEDNLEEEISSTVCTCDTVVPSLPFPSRRVGVSGPSRPRPFLPTDNVPRVPTKFGAQITTERATVASTSTATPAPTSQCASEANWSGKQCATLYQDQDCIGWRLDVAIGYTKLTLIESYNDAAEVIVLRPGCKFVGKCTQICLQSKIFTQ